MKKIIIAGATGLIGKALTRQAQGQGYEIYIISRDSKIAQQKIPGMAGYLSWSDTEKIGEIIDGSYGIINLTGAPIVGKRWTQSYKKIILDSRIRATETIVFAIKNAKKKPAVLINGSAIGYYGMHSTTIPFDENFPPGDDFLAKVCAKWENSAMKAEAYGVRVVCTRTAIVLDKNDGALPRMITPFFFFVGGPIGNGKQYFPWIHIEDEVGIIMYSLREEKVRGSINVCSPGIVTNKEFAKILGSVIHRPSFIPVPAFILQLLFGEASGVLTSGIPATPKKISDLGYAFTYPDLLPALRNIFPNKK